MASSDFPTRTHTTTRSFTYSYIHIQPSSPSKSYILFLHGFPSSSRDWRHQITYFSSKGYGIIAPDLLGFGNTSKPLSMHSYKFKDMASDLYEILSIHSISASHTAIGVGHDWGSPMLSRMVNYYPELFKKLVFLDVGYQAPDGPAFNFETVKMINAQIKEAAGFEIFGYFFLMNEEDGTELLNKNPESVMSLYYSLDSEIGKEYMGATGGFRKWLEGDVEHFKNMFSPKNGGFGGAKNWYTMQLHGINEGDDKAITKERTIVHQPTLLITSTNFISSGADFPSQMRPYIPNFRVERWECGHWIQLEKSDETNALLGEFFEEN
ncbi:epoxide hydrolase [Botrytis cinerea]